MSTDRRSRANQGKAMPFTSCIGHYTNWNLLLQGAVHAFSPGRGGTVGGALTLSSSSPGFLIETNACAHPICQPGRRSRHRHHSPLPSTVDQWPEDPVFWHSHSCRSGLRHTRYESRFRLQVLRPREHHSVFSGSFTVCAAAQRTFQITLTPCSDACSSNLRTCSADKPDCSASCNFWNTPLSSMAARGTSVSKQ